MTPLSPGRRTTGPPEFPFFLERAPLGSLPSESFFFGKTFTRFTGWRRSSQISFLYDVRIRSTAPRVPFFYSSSGTAFRGPPPVITSIAPSRIGHFLFGCLRSGLSLPPFFGVRPSTCPHDRSPPVGPFRAVFSDGERHPNQRLSDSRAGVALSTIQEMLRVSAPPFLLRPRVFSLTR